MDAIDFANGVPREVRRNMLRTLTPCAHGCENSRTARAGDQEKRYLPALGSDSERLHLGSLPAKQK
jgi:hypothetical protein